MWGNSGSSCLSPLASSLTVRQRLSQWQGQTRFPHLWTRKSALLPRVPPGESGCSCWRGLWLGSSGPSRQPSFVALGPCMSERAFESPRFLCVSFNRHTGETQTDTHYTAPIYSTIACLVGVGKLTVSSNIGGWLKGRKSSWRSQERGVAWRTACESPHLEAYRWVSEGLSKKTYQFPSENLTLGFTNLGVSYYARL